VQDFANANLSDPEKRVVQLPNRVFIGNRVLGSVQRFIVSLSSLTYPELKSDGCHLGTIEEFFSGPKNKMAAPEKRETR